MLTCDSFRAICKKLGVNNLALLVLNYDKFDDAEKEYIAARLRSEAVGDQEEANLALEAAGSKLDQGLYISSFRELQKEIIPRRLREPSSQSFVVAHNSGEDATANHQEHTATLSPMSSSVGPMASPFSSNDAGAGLGGANECQNGREHLVSGDNHAAHNPCARGTEAAVSNEESLFCSTQPSTDSGYMSNAGSQQWHHTTSVASSSGAFLLPSPLSSRLPTQQGTVAAAGESGGERTVAAAGQKRPQVEDNRTSKRHMPSAEEATKNSGPSEASNVDPESATSTSHAVPQGDVATGAVSAIADPMQHQELAQELGFNLDEWDSMCSSFPVSSITAYNWDGMFDSIPATSTMVHGGIAISDELQDVDFSENAATLPAFLSEPQPSGTVPPADEAET
ncbi:hypothetical protein ISF_09853 [Cordyceps fumosorosea ARSEF 2679]|uniref:Uncharacterized protein n=1 Tax=Cordyceps fumosorosea (strain ARSEF 2679) TaxID=1081104 RepID=A0A162J4W3_CORFA|nr:hypothetical protein ISF_09853 [Cordyceps fumosorosea ARSEF 2679]OAA39478.1 hypothetical protein ISF_09853 [Cordyceps fumosorosea ARSEF 2679]